MKTEARILEIAREKRFFRLAELVAAGVHPEDVRRLTRQGKLTRVGRGLYAWPTPDPEEHHMLARVATRLPKGTFCLLTALRFHGLANVQPTEMWVALDRRLGIPTVDFTPVRIVRTSGAALTVGIEEHEVEQVSVRITSPARTVVDCFKFRNKIGLDVTLDALKNYTRLRKGTAEEVWALAEALRMSNVIRPYWAWLL